MLSQLFIAGIRLCPDPFFLCIFVGRGPASLSGCDGSDGEQAAAMASRRWQTSELAGFSNGDVGCDSASSQAVATAMAVATALARRPV